MYRIREVDSLDDEIIDTISLLHKATSTFPDIGDDAFEGGHWWLAYLSSEPVAFAGMVRSRRWAQTGYLHRCGVLPQHRGNGLQRRLMKVREQRAKRNGWTHIVSDCTENLHSANNFIRSGYLLYEPRYPWAFSNTLYWIKKLKAP